MLKYSEMGWDQKVTFWFWCVGGGSALLLMAGFVVFARDMPFMMRFAAVGVILCGAAGLVFGKKK